MFDTLRIMMDSYPWWLFWFTIVLLIVAGCFSEWTPFYRNTEITLCLEPKKEGGENGI